MGLIPFNKRTEDEQREIARKGGKKSGEVRRQRAELNKLVNDWLNEVHTTKSGKLSGSQAVANQIITTALNPDSRYWGKAIDIILQISGALVSDEQRERQQAELELAKAKAKKMTTTESAALGKLDSILEELTNGAANYWK